MLVRVTSWGAIVTGIPCRVCGSAQFPTARIGSKIPGVPCEHLCAECAAKLAVELRGDEAPDCHLTLHEAP